MEHIHLRKKVGHVDGIEGFFTSIKELTVTNSFGILLPIECHHLYSKLMLVILKIPRL